MAWDEMQWWCELLACLLHDLHVKPLCDRSVNGRIGRSSRRMKGVKKNQISIKIVYHFSMYRVWYGGDDSNSRCVDRLRHMMLSGRGLTRAAEGRSGGE